MTEKPRIAIAGIHIESSTFTPYVSTENDFDVTRGTEMLPRYPWMSQEWAQQADWVPLLHARALPGGVVSKGAYQTWKAEILDGLKQASDRSPLAGLLFDIHGAMSVEGLGDAEGDLITAIREVIGDAPLVSASMDLHGNISHALFDQCDLLTCYRTAPHVDTAESRERAAHNLVKHLRLLEETGQRPRKALVHVPILLPGEKTSTRVQPAKGLYDRIPLAEALPGITDAAIWVGFAWADQPRCKAAVVVTGTDSDQVNRQAIDLGQAVWDVRDEFQFVAPAGSMQDCLADAAVQLRRNPEAKPYFISDSGDNPGAGGADDVTVALAELLEWKPLREGANAIYASLVDPAAVRACAEAGVGARTRVQVGGKIDTRTPGPLLVQGTVTAVADVPRDGLSAVLRINAGSGRQSSPDQQGTEPNGWVDLILTSNRAQFASLEQYLNLGVDPREADLVVVKIGYLEPDLYDMQKGWMMALTPGGVDQGLLRLGHHRIDRPMFPFDTEFDFTPQVRN